MNQGDIVVRQSYGGDIQFRIERLLNGQAILRGLEIRLLADAPITDLIPAQSTKDEVYRGWDEASEHQTRRLEKSILRQLERYKARSQQTARDLDGYEPFELPGKVLHLDGDSIYMRKSLQVYGKLKVPAEGHYVPESQMADILEHLLPQVRPDIVVITGHDGLYKNRQDRQSLSSYKNSHNFVNAVRVARQFDRNRDTLTVIAGACQSHFEALMQAGANFASSPGRILIHALDPVQIAVKTAYTAIQETIDITEIITSTQCGVKGLGGIESRGSFRIGLPRVHFSTEKNL